MADNITMSMTLPDGTSTRPFTMDDLKEATRRLKRAGAPMKETPEDAAVRERASSVAAAELRQFIERAERLEEEKRAIADHLKEVFAEAKGRGYSVAAIKKLIAERRRDPSDVSEEAAILDLYRSALGM